MKLLLVVNHPIGQSLKPILYPISSLPPLDRFLTMKDSFCGKKPGLEISMEPLTPSIHSCFRNKKLNLSIAIGSQPPRISLYVETLTPNDLWLSAHIQSAVIPFSGAHIDPRDASKKNLLMDLLWTDCIEYKAFEQEPEEAR